MILLHFPVILHIFKESFNYTCSTFADGGWKTHSPPVRSIEPEGCIRIEKMQMLESVYA